MALFDRRNVLASGLAAGGLAAGGIAFAAPPRGRLVLHPETVLNAVPADFTGLSVEKAQLSDPAFFHAGNVGLIALYRRLTPHGVLRIGGNSSEFCWWKAADAATAPRIEAAGLGHSDNWMPQHQTPIAPQAVQALKGFLDACDWRCIWGFNFGTATPAANAIEAAFVARTLGPRLLAFQIGNEPDLYRTPNNKLRPAGWDFPDYLDEWTAQAKAILAAVPQAVFFGPDGTNSDWTLRFAAAAPKRLGKAVAGLSGHYYAGGPPESPTVTIANLLHPAPGVTATMDKIAVAATAAGLDYRMTEGNSCYRGGKPGMSNTLAAALWGGDYMLAMAAHGCKGVCFHGGSGAMIAHSLGDKMPGARTEADRKLAAQGAFYTPIAGNRQIGFSARPLYYGMQLAQHFAGTRMIAASLAAGGANATAYAAIGPKGARIAVFNKDAADLTLAVETAGLAGKTVRIRRLTGPGLDAPNGVGLSAGETVTGGETINLSVPRASAAVILL